MTLVLLGVALAAVMGAVNWGVRSSGKGAELTRAVFLAQELRERTLNLDFDNVAALDGLSFFPPIHSHGGVISGMTDWGQSISVEYRSPNDPSQTVSPGSSDLLYVRVEVVRNGTPRLTTGWLVTQKE